MYSLKMEAIGDCYVLYAKRLEAGRIHAPHLRDQINAIRYGGKHMIPWVARLYGKMRRAFIEGIRDYGYADNVGNRGIFVYFHLLPGIYEINEPVAPGQSRRYFARIGMNDLAEITREEARVCLQNTI